MLFTNLLASAAAFAGFAMGQSDPLPCSGVCVNTHDPSLIRRESDGTYFRFATGAGIPIHTAPEITGPWTYQGEVLNLPAQIDNSGNSDAWAPDVQYVDGTYYCYYSVSSFGTQNSAIGVATSSSMDPGTWTDHGSTGVESTTGDAYNAIDGNLLVTDNAHVFTFGSFWGGIQQTTLFADALQWFGDEPITVAAYPPSTAVEGPYLYAYGNYYYLFWSQGKCCDYVNDMPADGEEYKIMVCRSESEFGPFVSPTLTPTPHPKLLRILTSLSAYRSTPMALPARAMPESWFSAPTAPSTAPVARASTPTPPRVTPTSTTTMLTPLSDTRMATSSSVLTFSTGALGGLSFKRVVELLKRVERRKERQLVCLLCLLYPGNTHFGMLG